MTETKCKNEWKCIFTINSTAKATTDKFIIIIYYYYYYRDVNSKLYSAGNCVSSVSVLIIINLLYYHGGSRLVETFSISFNKNDDINSINTSSWSHSNYNWKKISNHYELQTQHEVNFLELIEIDPMLRKFKLNTNSQEYIIIYILFFCFRIFPCFDIKST